MRLFRRSSADQLTIVTERCWDDPQLDALADQLEAATAPEPRVFAALTAMAAVRDDPERLALTTSASAERLEDAVAVLQARASTSTGDGRADADASALLGRTLTVAAWSVRGSGRASTVGHEQAMSFFELLEHADAALDHALRLVPGHPAAASSKITAGMGLRVEPDEQWRRFEVARQVRPTLYEAHQRMLQYLCAKWFGSHEQMLDFARAVAETSAPGDPVGAVLATAWLELWLDGKDGKDVGADRGADEALAVASAERWLAGGDAALAHPYALEAHQLFAWFFERDPERAHWHLRQTRGRMAFFPWCYYRRSEARYRQALADAQPAG